MMNNEKIAVIGAAIADVLVGPVSQQVFETGSMPMESTKFSFGGDALNQTVILKKLGVDASLISKIGDDETGKRLLSFLKDNEITTEHVVVEEGLETGLNVVLVDEKAERYFLTNPKSSLRKLKLKDIVSQLSDEIQFYSFASIFVSTELGIDEMEQLFKTIKEKPDRILAADMTKAKNGERLSDLKKLLPYVDYIFPNEEEIALLTGILDVKKNAQLLVDAGVSCAVIKCGKKGCYIKTKEEEYEIPAYETNQVVDTTGAGDSFSAGFIYALMQGFSLKECGQFACAVASTIVEEMGATEGFEGIEKVQARIGKNI